MRVSLDGYTRTNDLGESLVSLTSLYVMQKCCSCCKGCHTYLKHTYLTPKHGLPYYVFVTLWPSTLGDDYVDAHSVSHFPRKFHGYRDSTHIPRHQSHHLGHFGAIYTCMGHFIACRVTDARELSSFITF
jgi:hypothetical protein